MTDWADIVRFPFTHPHYAEYNSRCRAESIKTAFIEQSWQLIITGLQRQFELNAAGARNLPNPELVALGKLVGNDLEFLMMPRSAGPSVPLALWSGGIAISELVRSEGYETLESTRYGGILDKMTSPTYKIWLATKTWAPQGALWNTISAQYVKVAALKRDTMHVFMRTHDLDSVFYREELVNWRAAKGKPADVEDGLTYHIIVGLDSFEVREVFKTEREAKAFLLTFLGQVEKMFDLKGMLAEGSNHRYRSQVWVDNARACLDTFNKKTPESLSAYLDHPLQEVVQQFVAAEARISPDRTFDPKAFSSVMDELLSKVPLQ